MGDGNRYLAVFDSAVVTITFRRIRGGGLPECCKIMILDNLKMSKFEDVVNDNVKI